MKPILNFLLGIAVVFGVCQAQTAPSSTRPRSAIASVKEEDFVIWDQRPGACANSTCTMTYYEGVQYLSIVHAGVKVVAGIDHDNKHYRAFIVVRNDSGNPVDIVPTRFRILHVKPVMRESRPIPAQEVAKTVKRKALWSNVFLGFVAGMATTEQTTHTTQSGSVQVVGPGGAASGTYSGSSTSTTTTPDPAFRRETAQRAQTKSAEAKAVAQSIEIGELRANTVALGQVVSGDTYFDRDKNAETLFLQIPVAGFLYIFPMLGPKFKAGK